jgi:hypothetical protein
MGGVVNRGEDVFPLEKRIILKDFLEGGSRAQQFQHILHTNAQSANAGTSPALAFFYGDSAKTFQAHP